MSLRQAAAILGGAYAFVTLRKIWKRKEAEEAERAQASVSAGTPRDDGWVETDAGNQFKVNW